MPLFMKNNLKDISLIQLAFVLNYLYAYIGFVVLSSCYHILNGYNLSETDFDKLTGILTFKSFESMIFILFLYFLCIDVKTLMSRKSNRSQEYESLENYSSKGKLILNRAFNIFKKIPFEYGLKHSIRIYFLRILLVTIVMLPLYIFQLFIFLISIFPVLSALLTLTILLGAALLYLFDTKIGRRIEQFLLNCIIWMKPDKVEILQNRRST